MIYRYLFKRILRRLMAKRLAIVDYIRKHKKKRPGVHSKNASKGQTGWKKKSRGQGEQR